VVVFDFGLLWKYCSLHTDLLCPWVLVGAFPGVFFGGFYISPRDSFCARRIIRFARSTPDLRRNSDRLTPSIRAPSTIMATSRRGKRIDVKSIGIFV
jgi:hypothetical protein